MLISLYPGLKCKKCDKVMGIAKDIPGSVNMVMKEGRMIVKGDFTCNITCANCNTIHLGIGFIRDGVFKGIHEYYTNPYTEEL